MKRYALLEAVCVFVLLVAASGKEVVVASYNLENYLKMERRVEGRTIPDAPKPEAEIWAVIEVLREIRPDVLGIIEMGDESMLEDFRSRLRAAGLDYPHREWVRGADAARHLALLSRFPIVARNSRDDVPFELHGSSQRIGRGILDVTVAVDETYRLRLVGAHLKSKRQVPDFNESAMRAKEAWFLREHLDAILDKNPDENLLLFGDLNDTKNEYSVKTLLGPRKDPRRMRDLPLTDRQGLRWTHFWEAADTYSRIDYILVSNGLWPEINLRKSGISNSPIWNEGSDHRAIFTTITIPKP